MSHQQEISFGNQTVELPAITKNRYMKRWTNGETLTVNGNTGQDLTNPAQLSYILINVPEFHRYTQDSRHSLPYPLITIQVGNSYNEGMLASNRFTQSLNRLSYQWQLFSTNVIQSLVLQLIKSSMAYFNIIWNLYNSYFFLELQN